MTKIDDKMINQVSETKFLGIYIGENLSWKSHIQNISKKIARATGILYKVRWILDTNKLRNLYFTFVYPYLTYCVHVWGNACKTYLTKLGKIQDEIIRIITYSTYKARSDPLYNALKLLKIKDIHKLSIGIFMFKYINRELPDIFISMFRYRHQVHSYNTRQSHHLHLEKFKTNLGLKSVKYYGGMVFMMTLFNWKQLTALKENTKTFYWTMKLACRVYLNSKWNNKILIYLSQH